MNIVREPGIGSIVKDDAGDAWHRKIDGLWTCTIGSETYSRWRWERLRDDLGPITLVYQSDPEDYPACRKCGHRDVPEPAEYSVVRDKDGDTWQRRGDRWRCEIGALGELNSTWETLNESYSPLTVLHDLGRAA